MTLRNHRSSIHEDTHGTRHTEKEVADNSDDNDNDNNKSWLVQLAILGDSPLALLMSLFLLLLSMGLSWSLQQEEHAVAYSRLGPPHSPLGPAKVFNLNNVSTAAEQITAVMQQAYAVDGVVALRGLISPQLLHQLQDAADQWVQQQHLQNAQRRQGGGGNRQFFTVQHGVVFRNPQASLQQQQHETSYESTSNATMDDNAFVQLLLQSSLGHVAATLLHPTMDKTNHSKKNLRLMRDIFLAKDDDPFVCGWHVDDHGFWPATADSPGINAWIALDDYNNIDDSITTNDPEGGFALAVGSHTAHWRNQAYQVTGAAHTVPSEGFTSAADMVQRRQGSGTCNIKHAAPHLQQRLEETKRVYKDLQAGDIIFHDRWLFHRTIPQSSGSNKVLRRYSIRMSPGSSVIPPGYGIEPSVLFNPQHGGQTADQVTQKWPWYPRVWPTANEKELLAWTEFCRSIYPQAIEKQTMRKKELKPYLQKLAQQQQAGYPPQANNLLHDLDEVQHPWHSLAGDFLNGWMIMAIAMGPLVLVVGNIIRGRIPRAAFGVPFCACLLAGEGATAWMTMTPSWTSRSLAVTRQCADLSPRLFSSSSSNAGESIERYQLLKERLTFRGPVDRGYGRGGKKLGFPTANLPSSLFQNALSDVQNGVYFGWALLEGNDSVGRNIPHKAVVNVGLSPTFQGEENPEKVIEAHLIIQGHTLDPPDFYGETMRLQLDAFMRPEQKFPSFDQLIAQITADVQDSNAALDKQPFAGFRHSDFLTQINSPWIGSGGGDETASWERTSMNEFL